ncbi:MAG: virulence RhuM family protein [Lentimicrobiaceae bacterium]|nr:virulence RhuM family protein [Lentimicrobiaceae bacterium]
MNQNEIVLYQPDNSIKLEVRFENETVWLSLNQIATLFNRDKSVISRHIKNIFEEEELFMDSVVANFATTAADGKIYQVEYFNLDVIISVGYRVKSKQGTRFRQWANPIIKDYLLKGYVVNQRIERLEYRMTKAEEKIGFFVKTALPPTQGIFFDDQIFDAYTFASGLIKSAKKSIILIDNYVDESVLLLLSKRAKNVSATIYTSTLSPQLQLDLQRHNAQYSPVTIEIFTRSHDRFLFIDESVYHIGASLKDLGKRWFAFSKMVLGAKVLLQHILKL